MSLHWTKDKPNKEGWYFHKRHNVKFIEKYRPFFVDVSDACYEDSGEPVIEYFEQGTMVDPPNKGVWAGPIDVSNLLLKKVSSIPKSNTAWQDKWQKDFNAAVSKGSVQVVMQLFRELSVKLAMDSNKINKLLNNCYKKTNWLRLEKGA